MNMNTKLHREIIFHNFQKFSYKILNIKFPLYKFPYLVKAFKIFITKKFILFENSE